jgi:hypothetical protein
MGNGSRFFQYFLIDSFLFILSFFFFLFFFSLFLFPQTEKFDPISIFHRVLLFITGKHGSIYHVNDGVKLEKQASSIKNNAGLVLIDSSSAAMISKTTRFHRACGPGIVLIQKNEILADTVDLRRQKQIIGPLEGEDPFTERQKSEKPDVYFARIHRASETKAISRDGQEIVASFIIKFKIKSNPGTGGTPFGYDPLSVERALLGQTVNLVANQNNETEKNWTSLPGLLAANIWRELINKFRMIDLIAINEQNLIFILENIFTRLCKKEYEEINEIGKKTGKFVPSKEFKFLEDRGIVLLEIQLRQLYLHPEIEQSLINQWEPSLSNNSNFEQIQISHNRDQAISDGKQSGIKIATNLVSQIINGLAKEGKLIQKNLVQQIQFFHEYYLERGSVNSIDQFIDNTKGHT